MYASENYICKGKNERPPNGFKDQSVLGWHFTSSGTIVRNESNV